MNNDCTNCNQVKNENKVLRRSLVDNNKNYVEVVNENLSLRRDLEQSIKEKEQLEDQEEEILEEDASLDTLQGIWDILDETEGSEAFVYDLVSNSIKSWRAAKSYGRISN
jgi:hypothetical protein